MTHARFPDLQIWENHVRRVLEVLHLALDKLQAKSDLPTDEVPLNLILAQCIRLANAELRQGGRGVEWPASFDGIQAMHPEDEEIPRDAQKRPDIKWAMYDSQETDLEKQERSLDIECKRLAPQGGVLPREYVVNGVCRFLSPTHRYGRFARDGAMIGYTQQGEFIPLFAKVNACLSNRTLPDLELGDGEWRDAGTTRLQHRRPLARSELPSPFNLVHLWVDLRSKYVTRSEPLRETRRSSNGEARE